MNILSTEYNQPFDLLDGVISTGRFCDFLVTFEKKRKERQRWEFYIHKLPSWDDTTWEEFNDILDRKEDVFNYQKASKEELETTIKNSYNMLNNFNIGKGG